MDKNRSPQMRLFSLGFVLFVTGCTYQVLNAIHWGWWDTPTEPYYFKEAAIYNGRTLAQIITMQFGWLAGPLILITFAMTIYGLILIWREGNPKKEKKREAG